MRSNSYIMRRKGSLLAIAAASVLTVIVAPTPAMGGDGGVTSGGGISTPGSDVPSGSKAKLASNGEAVAPADAPPKVQKVIDFANRIRKKPYRLGGGHKSWKIDKAYDCSGAVSYALHGGHMIDSPVPSGSLADWGKKGKGEWITVYANGGHAYAIIAGLRWDTAGDSHGSGPRWHKDLDAAAGGKYAKRHFPGY